MADEGIFATTAEVQRKVGANASATSNVEAYINDFMTQAESYINVLCGFNFSDTYATLNVDVKAILKEAASNIAAIYVINYDIGAIAAITSRTEAEDRIMVMWERAEKCIELLQQKTKIDFIKAAG